MVPFGRTAAIFDVDDSLLDGNAGTIFTWYLYSEKIMRPEMRARIPRIIYEYARHRLTEQDMVEVGSRCQQGLRADELKAHAHRCFQQAPPASASPPARCGTSASTSSPATSSCSPPARRSTSSTRWGGTSACTSRSGRAPGSSTGAPPTRSSRRWSSATESARWWSASPSSYDLDLSRSLPLLRLRRRHAAVRGDRQPGRREPQAPVPRASPSAAAGTIVEWHERNKGPSAPDTADEWGSWDG